MGISWQELIIVLLIVLVVFGPKRLPEIGSSLGRGIRGFKDGMNGRDQLESTVQRAATQQQPPQAAVNQADAGAAEHDATPPAPVEVVDPRDH